MNNVVQISSVYKSFGSVKALKNIEFDVSSGELFGIIGPDGSGKTTLFRILNTLLVPDAGSVKVLGKDVVENYRDIRPQLGYMPGRFSLYEDLTVEENLGFFASVFGVRVDEHMDLIKPVYSKLEPFKDRLAGALSGGMKQKLALSCALIHKPTLLLLDEPTTGVDAVSRKEFWTMLGTLKEEGITIIVSTPYMDEANQCDRVALIQEGELMEIDTPTAIVESFNKPLMGIKSKNTYQVLLALKSYPEANSVHPFGDYIHYTGKGESIDTEALHTYLERNDIFDASIERIKPGIEDSFMALMKSKGEK